MKTRRDASLFEKERENQKAMSALAEQGKIRLYYFDETGFSLEPSVPYAWQPVGGQAEIPSFKSKRLNVLGFLSKGHPASFHTVEGRVRSAEAAAAFDAFASGYAAEYQRHKIPCVVVLDNATNHTSKAFCSQWDKWASMGVVVHYLPTYSPELNLIEILWRKIKYEWLPFSCYSAYDSLKKALYAILDGFGSEYQIKYA
jgi:transposase